MGSFFYDFKQKNMPFSFIPFKLNADIQLYQNKIQYISSDNGVDFYKAKEGFINHLLGFPVFKVSLYFFEGSLITVYLRFHEDAGNLIKVRNSLEKVILKQAEVMETDSGFVHYWQINDQFLGLLMQDNKNIIIMYNSLNEYNIFNQYL